MKWVELIIAGSIFHWGAAIKSYDANTLFISLDSVQSEELIEIRGKLITVTNLHNITYISIGSFWIGIGISEFI